MLGPVKFLDGVRGLERNDFMIATPDCGGAVALVLGGCLARPIELDRYIGYHWCLNLSFGADADRGVSRHH